MKIGQGLRFHSDRLLSGGAMGAHRSVRVDRAGHADLAHFMADFVAGSKGFEDFGPNSWQTAA